MGLSKADWRFYLFFFFLLGNSALGVDEEKVPLDLRVTVGGIEEKASLVKIITSEKVEGQTVATFSRYELRYLDRTVRVSEAEARELRAAAAEFANPLKKISVARTTSGYAAGTPSHLLVAVKDGKLVRYSGDETRLLEKYREKPPLALSVRYALPDAVREPFPDGLRMDPHGRIVLMDGQIAYTNYSKPVPIFERNRDGRQNALGEFPSLEKALAQAKKGDNSLLRYAADFGPQRPTPPGGERPNQLLPLIPIDRIFQDGKAYAVTLPIDQLQAYRRGEIEKKNLFLIPEDVLRFVPDSGEWNEIVDDYLDLRKEKTADKIFVANRGGGASQEMTMNSLSLLKDPDEAMKRVVAPREVSQSIIDLHREPKAAEKKENPPRISGAQRVLRACLTPFSYAARLFRWPGGTP